MMRHRKILDSSCWIARIESIGLAVLGNHGTGSDYTSISNRHTRHNDCPSPYPTSVANGDRVRKNDTCTAPLSPHGMGNCTEHDIHRNVAITSDSDWAIEVAAVIYKGVFSYHNVRGRKKAASADVHSLCLDFPKPVHAESNWSDHYVRSRKSIDYNVPRNEADVIDDFGAEAVGNQFTLPKRARQCHFPHHHDSGSLTELYRDMRNTPWPHRLSESTLSKSWAITLNRPSERALAIFIAVTIFEHLGIKQCLAIFTHSIL